MSVEHEHIDPVENRWQNVYWFARKLISQDKYGGVGGENDLLNRIVSALKVIREENSDLHESKILGLQKQSLREILDDRFKNAPKRKHRVNRLIEDLNHLITSIEDMEVFVFTCESVMLPINDALDNIPSDDKEFTLDIAKTYLSKKGEEGLATVIKLWDDIGLRGSLKAERREIVKAYATLRTLLNRKDISENEKDLIKTAFVQEFERRVGNKRTKRAGVSLEDATAFILDYFDIESTNAPDHFQADIEIDNWVPIANNWLIGISCKRTLRERWKQVSSASSQTLSEYKIKQLFHIVTYDEDLSDQKLAQLGGQRHTFYLPDNSKKLEYASNHEGLQEYVRPVSKLISDLKEEMSQ